jgi:transcriptional regulator with XRE-family HTH domain
MTIGERIRAARKKKGLTQADLGAILGVSYQVISQYERGLRKPKYETIQRIAAALDLSDDALIYGYEIDREYELVCDTLTGAGFKIGETVINYGGGPEHDRYLIFHADDENEEAPKEIEYGRLVDIVTRVLKGAETNKAMYIRDRLYTEIFLPKGIRPDGNDPKK